MTKGFNIIANFIASLIIAGMLIGAFVLYQKLTLQNGGFMEQLDFNIILLTLCILLGSLAIRSGIVRSSRNTKPHLPEKTVTYKQFTDYFFTGLQMDDGWHELTSAMTMWASDSVLRQYLQLIGMLEEKKDYDILQKKAEKVVLEIRIDLGNTNLGILIGDLIKTEKRFEKYESKKKTQETANI